VQIASGKLAPRSKHNAATIGPKIGKVINKHKMAKHFEGRCLLGV
jgi:hypothetical protein